jgi:Na+/melibiose symporter-like transporter
VPSQALALALAASIYPPAVAAVIALGRGAQVRSRVAAFVAAAALTTYAVGALILLVLVDSGASGSTKWTPSAAIDLVLGVALLALAVRLWRKGQEKQDEASEGEETSKQSGTSKIERYLENRRLAFVLGVTLYILPSPIYIGAVKAVADAKLSTSSELLALAATVAVMLWMVELPMLMLLVVPGRAAAALESTNLWFARNGRMLAVIASAGVGVYLVVRGLAGLLS